VRRLDFRQCLPVPHRRQTRTTYLVISERDPATVAKLARAYPAATITPIQPEEAALMGEATLVEVPPGAAAPALPQRAHARFEPGLSLYGFEWSGKTVKAGESLLLTLYWVAENEFEADVTRFLHVGTGDEGLPLIAQHDGQPCQGLYPTSSWQLGEMVPDGFAVTLPEDAPSGDYPLVVGWYRYPSLERLPLASAGTPLAEDRAVIATLTVTAPWRTNHKNVPRSKRVCRVEWRRCTFTLKAASRRATANVTSRISLWRRPTLDRWTSPSALRHRVRRI